MNSYDLELFNKFLDSLKEMNLKWTRAEVNYDTVYTVELKNKTLSVTIKPSNSITFEIGSQFSCIIAQGNPLQKKILEIVNCTEYHSEFSKAVINYINSIIGVEGERLNEDDKSMLISFFNSKKYQHENKLKVNSGRGYATYTFLDGEYSFEIKLSDVNKKVIELSITDGKSVNIRYIVSREDEELYITLLNFIDRKDMLCSFPYRLTRYFELAIK